MFLPSSNARVRTLNISRSLIASILLGLAGVLVLSVYFVCKYNDVKGQVRELQSMREELMQQKIQVQNYALNLIDYKRQMFLIHLLKDLPTTLFVRYLLIQVPAYTLRRIPNETDTRR